MTTKGMKRDKMSENAVQEEVENGINKWKKLNLRFLKSSYGSLRFNDLSSK